MLSRVSDGLGRARQPLFVEEGYHFVVGVVIPRLP